MDRDCVTNLTACDKQFAEECFEIPYCDRRVFQGAFQETFREIFHAGLHNLGSRKVGLVGFGDIASHTAKLLGSFGCEIYYYNRNRRDEAITVPAFAFLL